MSRTVVIRLKKWWGPNGCSAIVHEDCLLYQIKTRFMALAKETGLIKELDARNSIPHIAICRAIRNEDCYRAVDGSMITITRKSFSITRHTVEIDVGRNAGIGRMHFTVIYLKDIAAYREFIENIINDICVEFDIIERDVGIDYEHKHAVDNNLGGVARVAEARNLLLSNILTAPVAAPTIAALPRRHRQRVDEHKADKPAAKPRLTNKEIKANRDLLLKREPRVKRELKMPRIHKDRDEKEADFDDEKQCKICYETKWDAIIDCGHMCLCMSCAKKISKCPYCSAVITKRQKMYVV